MAEGKKGRKHGNKKGKPSQIRYVAERRSERNKARKQLRHLKAVEKKLARLERGAICPRGEARAAKRSTLDAFIAGEWGRT